MIEPINLSESAETVKQQKSMPGVNGLCNPVNFMLTSGQVNDCNVAITLLYGVEIEGSSILADRSYATPKIIDYISQRNADYTIPSKSSESHLVECFFNKIKAFRHGATRYDKLATSISAFVNIALNPQNLYALTYDKVP